MPTYWTSIPPDVQTWMLAQPVFFTASAPTHGSHINVSPKGYPSRSFAILSPERVAYLDGTGSGIETVSHAYENGRITLMFCSFTKFCRILRLFCKARIIERSDKEFKGMIQKMGKSGMRVEGPDQKLVQKLGEEGKGEEVEVNFDVEKEGNGVLGVRAIVVLDVWKVQHSCGYGVPLLAGVASKDEEEEGDVISGPNVNVGSNDKRSDDPNDTHSTKFDEAWDDRNVLNQFAVGQIKKRAIKAYRVKNNAASLDKLPGLEMAMKDLGQNPRLMRLQHKVGQIFQYERPAIVLGVFLGLFLALLFQRVAIRLS